MVGAAVIVVGTVCGNLSRSSSTMRSAVFLPIPGHIVAADCSDHFIGGHAAQNCDGQLGSDSADRNQLLKQYFFRRAEKSVERDRVFPNMRVNVQGDLGSDSRQVGKRGDANGDVVAHACGFHNSLVWMFG